APTPMPLISIGLRLAEAVGAGEALRHAAAGSTARAAPRGQVEFGARAVFALPPREPVCRSEHLGVGKAAGTMPLQDDAAAARHLRNFGEIDDQHAAVLADKGGRVAPSRDADCGARAECRG